MLRDIQQTEVLGSHSLSMHTQATDMYARVYVCMWHMHASVCAHTHTHTNLVAWHSNAGKAGSGLLDSGLQKTWWWVVMLQISLSLGPQYGEEGQWLQVATALHDQADHRQITSPFWPQFTSQFESSYRSFVREPTRFISSTSGPQSNITVCFMVIRVSSMAFSLKLCYCDLEK